MRQTDLWRPEKPRSYLSQNCFELLVKTITAFCNYACIAVLDWIRLARTCPPSFSRMLGSELDSCKCTVWCSATNLQIIMSRSYAGNGLIASFVRTPRSAIVFAVSSAAAFYRASGLVHWHFSDMGAMSNL